MLILYCLISILTYNNAEGEPISPSADKGNHKASSKPKLVWSFPLGNDAISIDPLYYYENVLFSSGKIEAPSVVLLSLNAKTGASKWKCKELGENIGFGNKNYYHIFMDKLIYGIGKETGVIDLSSGQTVWQDTTGFAPRLSVIGNYIYREHDPEGIRDPYSQLVRSPISFPQWDTIFTLYQDSLNGYSPSIENPSLWMNPDGDSILVFQNRGWHFDNSDGRIDFYAYNLSQGEVQFVLEDIDPSGNSNVIAPLVDGNYAYFLGARSISCIDLINESIVWQEIFYGSGAHALTSNLLVIGDKLIVKQDDSYLTAYNKLKGSVIWQQTEAGYTPSHMEFYNGIIYYIAEGDGKLMAVDTDSGKIIWAEKSPNEEKEPNAYFYGGVAINPNEGYIYVHDWHYAMCFKLPEAKQG